MNYADKLEEILKEPKEFFANFSLNNECKNEEDMIKKAKEYKEALNVMETALGKLEDLEPELFDKIKHNIIKESFRKNTDTIRQIVDAVNIDHKNMASSKVTDLINQIKF